MRHIRSVVVLLAVLLLGAAMAFGQADSLTYIGHSFFKIKTLSGTVIYIDPCDVDAFADSADILLVTHEHSDHNEVSRVHLRSTGTLIRSAQAVVSGAYQSFTIGPVHIQAVPAYNMFHTKGECVGYVLTFDGISLYHAGDTGYISETTALTPMHLAYALLPMDGTYTVTPEVATRMAAAIQAAHDIPMHTMAPPDSYSDAIVARFTSPNKLVVRPGATIVLTPVTTAAPAPVSTPMGYSLEQNYPNPFNPMTTLRYTMGRPGHVRIAAFDLNGREVALLVDGEQAAGAHSVRFGGENLSSGMYFLRMTAGDYTGTVRAMLVR